MLERVLIRFLNKMNGECVDCGHNEVGFTHDKDMEQYVLVCKKCGGTKIRNISFTHMKKVFRVDFVENARVEVEKGREENVDGD